MTGPFNDMISDFSEDGDKLRRQVTEALDRNERNSFAYLWEYTAPENQLPPEGDWRIWMIMAGRGFGKTRSGAEWVRMIADANPDARIALVSSSLAEARAVMVKGESGLLAICWPGHKPLFEPSLHRVRFRNGAQAQLFSAAEPESLRSPQHSHACRSGAEGVLRQPGTRPAGCPPRPSGHRVPPGTAGRCCRGRAFRVTATATGAWAGHEDSIAILIGGGWHFVAPAEGMLLFDRDAVRTIMFRSQWEVATAPVMPSAGAVVDTEARAALAGLIQALMAIGILGPAAS